MLFVEILIYFVHFSAFIHIFVLVLRTLLVQYDPQ
jgi:hypothetical protein